MKVACGENCDAAKAIVLVRELGGTTKVDGCFPGTCKLTWC